MRLIHVVYGAALGLAAGAGPAIGQPVLSNPGFEETVTRPAEDPEMLKLANLGWKFLDQPILWPVGWNAAQVSNITFAIERDNPHTGQQCLQLWGQLGSSGYLRTRVRGLKPGLYKGSFYGRGSGKATLMAPGIWIILNRPMRETWARYSGILRNTAGAAHTDLTLQASGGPVWFDDLTLEECDPLEARRVLEELRLASAGALLEADAPVEAAAYQAQITAITQALPTLRTLVEADPIPENVAIIALLAERAGELQRATSPTAGEMNTALCYRTLTEQMLQELAFEEVEEGS
jgi:hypothetical protein